MFTVERPNLRVTNIENKLRKLIYIEGQIWELAKFRMDEQFQNCQFSQPNFGFLNWKNSRNLLIAQFGQFQKLWFWKLPKISDLEN